MTISDSHNQYMLHRNRSNLPAKCIILHHSEAPTTSANFTEAAQEHNIEVGVKVRHYPRRTPGILLRSAYWKREVGRVWEVSRRARKLKRANSPPPRVAHVATIHDIMCTIYEEIAKLAQQTIEGMYKDGRIELDEKPRGVKSARVTVTFLPETSDEASAQRKAEIRRTAGKRMLERMREGIDFGGEKFNREEIYEDRMKELDARRARH